MIFSLFKRNSAAQAVEDLYGEIVEQARNPVFYSSMAVPDTVEGRFDVLALHAFLVLRRLKAADENAAHFANRLFSVMIQDLDSNLRELGAGDLTVGKKVRGLTEAFLGRAEAYEKALQQSDDSLAAALDRNLYGRESEGVSPEAKSMADYARNCVEELANQSTARLGKAIIKFAALPENITSKK